ncbi:heterocyst specific ABC-transporter, membrane fusion protein DevB [Crocosphaera watsonii WH 0402]|uniref:Heterocyst specific ABC-transporter, membrane fusion protein DevB n=1 Tax=Crocosphaera watsonii WH 0402 TaxID=1284629 RepID=T2JS50_CROWT|nr:biotin/lipoyl-binding protein [Crocosphaera watsonii]CCQ67849.1 heterocyst specific ABC-transporter, membrane fusion protein DevB [Crocosphaera watsonii WH 0402]
MTKLKRQNQWLNPILMVIIAIISSSVTALMIRSQGLTLSNHQSSPVKEVSPKNTPIETVAALGRLEPSGEVIHVTVPTVLQGARVEQLFVKLGDRLKQGEIIAILHNYPQLQAALNQPIIKWLLPKPN